MRKIISSEITHLPIQLSIDFLFDTQPRTSLFLSGVELLSLSQQLLYTNIYVFALPGSQGY